MLRENWEFEFSAAKLIEAAKKKKANHSERLKFWEGSKEKVMADVRESGIEVSESLATTHSNRGVGPRVMVRNDLQAKLTECHDKIQEHAEKIRAYDGWAQVLEGNSETRLRLNADDYLFFFGT